MLITFCAFPFISDHDQSKGRGKQSLAIPAVIIIIVIVAAYVYAYSEAPLQPTHLYEGIYVLLILTILLLCVLQKNYFSRVLVLFLS